MNFELDAQYLEIQERARKFADAIEPVAAQADEMSEIHPGVLDALRESGLSRLMVPGDVAAIRQAFVERERESVLDA